MNKNFNIENLTDLCVENERFDVHNDFDFSGFEFSLSTATARIVWSGSDRLNIQLIMSFVGINYVGIRPGDIASPDSTVTKVIGFLDAEFRGDFDSFDYDRGAEDRDFIIILENDTSVKISCEAVGVDVVR